MTDIDLQANLIAVRGQVNTACNQFARIRDSVNVLAVSKTKPASMIQAANLLGQRHFGENYLQEALSKISELDHADIDWHYIGAIQSNKTRAIAESFNWVHTVANDKIARRLNDQRPPSLPPLKVLLQVNISDEDSKAGLAPDAVMDLAQRMLHYPMLELRGLMAIPAPVAGFDAQRQAFAQLRLLKESVAERMGSDLPAFNDLSMGMSADMHAAIAEGATWLRLGTAIFGARD